MTDIISTELEVPSNTVEPWHCHAETQLLFSSRGTMRAEVAGQSWLISPQCALWVPAQTPHQVAFCTDVDLCALYFRDEPQENPLPDPRLRFAALTKPQISVTSPLLREVILAIARIGGYSGSAKDERLGLLLGLLANEAHNCARSFDAIVLPRSGRLRKVCTQIVARPSNNWTIEECARQAVMSRRTFTRAFRAEMGMSLGEWRRATRLNGAAVKLRSGKSIATVAYEVGYGSPAAFSASFRDHFGISPSAF